MLFSYWHKLYQEKALNKKLEEENRTLEKENRRLEKELQFLKDEMNGKCSKNDKYEIELWVMPDKVYDIIVKMSSRKFKKLAGENAFWAEWVGNGVERDEYGRVTGWSWTELP